MVGVIGPPPPPSEKLRSATCMDSPARKKPPPDGVGVCILAATYFCVTFRQAIIGAGVFHFRVRDGNGWCHRAVATRFLSLIEPSISDGLFFETCTLL